MTKKLFEDSELGRFTVSKKRNAKRITLRVAANGVPNVTIPTYSPYAVGVAFFKNQRSWVEKHSKKVPSFAIGSSYELYDGTVVSVLAANTRNTTRKNRIGQLEIRRVAGENGQMYANKAVLKHLATDSSNAILPRIQSYSARIGVEPSSVRFRATTSRWGSCSSKKVLTFSSYIAQLPNELIDYIVIHELSHILEMNHGKTFWAHVAAQDPDYKQHRKDLHEHKLEPYLKKQ